MFLLDSLKTTHLLSSSTPCPDSIYMILRPTQRKVAAHRHSVVSGITRMKTTCPESSVHLGVVMQKKARAAGSGDPTSRSKAIHHGYRQIGTIGKAHCLTQRCLMSMHFSPYLKISQNQRTLSTAPLFKPTKNLWPRQTFMTTQQLNISK